MLVNVQIKVVAIALNLIANLGLAKSVEFKWGKHPKTGVLVND